MSSKKTQSDKVKKLTLLVTGRTRYLPKLSILKSKIIRALKYLAFFAVGIFIFWMLYRDQSFSEIKTVLQNKVNYFWVLVPLVIGLIAHFCRALRWRILIEPLGKKPSRTNTFMAVMIGYLMNLVFPRLGEVSRCGILSQYEDISFTRLIGTVVLERAVDVLMLLFMTLIAVFSEFDAIISYWYNHPQIRLNLQHVLFSPFTIAIILIIIILLILAYQHHYTNKFSRKIKIIWSNILEGLKTFKTMRRKKEFIFHSILIWVLYFLMLYTGFFALSATSHLSPIAALTTFVFGSIGMVAPVQGGIGAWHFMTKEALGIYGISKQPAIIFALLSHTTMTLLIIVVGLICLIAIPFVNRKKH